jgi:protein-S-isoprenylcysteine O-methyltransferase Ste14
MQQGSLPATALLTTLQLWAFYTRSIPGIGGYMSAKYGPEWTDYKRRVPYALIPGVL